MKDQAQLLIDQISDDKILRSMSQMVAAGFSNVVSEMDGTDIEITHNNLRSQDKKIDITNH